MKARSELFGSIDDDKGSDNLKYPEEARDRAFFKYLETGSVAATSVICGLAKHTVRKWSLQENWQSKLKRHRKQKRREVLRTLYHSQIAQLKEFAVEISDSDKFRKKLITNTTDDDRKSFFRAAYGSQGLRFHGEELSISWFTQRLKRDPDRALEMENGQEIRFASTPCQFGGVRWWFLCPECETRREKLYKKKDKYGCRVCLRLRYLKKTKQEYARERDVWRT